MLNNFQKSALAFAEAFTQGHRGVSGGRKACTAACATPCVGSYVYLADHAEQWMKDAIRRAHGERLPDDTIYKLCKSAASYVYDNAETPEEAGDRSAEFADSEVDTYNHDRAEWLAKSHAHAAIVDEAVEEMGHSKDGLYGDIALGQYKQALDVYGVIVSAIEDDGETMDACDAREEMELKADERK